MAPRGSQNGSRMWHKKNTKHTNTIKNSLSFFKHQKFVRGKGVFIYRAKTGKVK
jgi:hypothetical protein